VKLSSWFKILLVLILATQIGGLVNWSRSEIAPLVAEKAIAQNEVAELNRLVKQADGLVLADEYAGLIPLAGKPLLFQPIEFKMLNEAGLWGNQPVIEQINKKTYRYILLYIPIDHPQYVTERWSPEIRNAIYANYQNVDTLASVYIYAPKP
jgi:hypothetical protein